MGLDVRIFVIPKGMDINEQTVNHYSSPYGEYLVGEGSKSISNQLVDVVKDKIYYSDDKYDYIYKLNKEMISNIEFGYYESLRENCLLALELENFDLYCIFN